MLEKELMKIGLSEKEAKVYLASLELGPAPVQKISQKAKVNRATTYVVIDDLQAMGLMSTFEEGKKTFFIAEQPERLMSHLKGIENEVHEQISLLQQKLPELQSIFNTYPDKPLVKYYGGIEGLRSVQEDFITSLGSGDIVYTFLPFDDYEKIRSGLNLKKYVDQRTNKKIHFKILYTSTKGRNENYEKENVEGGDEIKYIGPDGLPFKAGMNIYGNKIFLIDYSGRTGGVIIENKNIADLIKSIFMLLWNKIDCQK